MNFAFTKEETSTCTSVQNNKDSFGGVTPPNYHQSTK